MCDRQTEKEATFFCSKLSLILSFSPPPSYLRSDPSPPPPPHERNCLAILLLLLLLLFLLLRTIFHPLHNHSNPLPPLPVFTTTKAASLCVYFQFAPLSTRIKATTAGLFFLLPKPPPSLSSPFLLVVKERREKEPSDWMWTASFSTVLGKRKERRELTFWAMTSNQRVGVKNLQFSL